MKIYFAGSIRGGREKQKKYSEIIRYLQKYGEVLTEHVGSSEISDSGEENISVTEIYERDISFIKEASFFVAEVSVPSLGVGYEIAKAESLGKKILCIYESENNNVSAMIRGNNNLLSVEYSNTKELFDHINKFISSK